MNISSVLGALARRWYVAVVVLGVTGFLAAQLWQQAEPVYSSTTVVSVVRSPAYLQAQQSEDPLVTMGNPYGDATTTLAGLLADSIAHGNIDLSDDAPGASFTVQTNNQRAESFFTVGASAPDREGALAALLVLQDEAPALLADIPERAGAPADQLMTAILTRPATAPQQEFPDRSRLVLGTVLAGMLATALLCVAVDGAVAASRRRRNAARAERRSSGTPVEGGTGARGRAGGARSGEDADRLTTTKS